MIKTYVHVFFDNYLHEVSWTLQPMRPLVQLTVKIGVKEPIQNVSLFFYPTLNKNTLETCKNPRPTSGWSELTVLHNIKYEFPYGMFFMNSKKQCQVIAIL